jgi:hypothetical protein
MRPVHRRSGRRSEPTAVALTPPARLTPHPYPIPLGRGEGAGAAFFAAPQRPSSAEVAAAARPTVAWKAARAKPEGKMYHVPMVPHP